MKTIAYYLQIGRTISKIWFFISTFADYYLIPNSLHRCRWKYLKQHLTEEEKKIVNKRVEYYSHIKDKTTLSNSTSVAEYKYPRGKKKKHTPYWCDLYNTIKYMPLDKRFLYEFGDITWLPKEPSFVKSRPIVQTEYNTAVLLKLDSWRHFHFIDDTIPFVKKKDMMIARTTWANPNPLRLRMLQMFSGHPMCNVAKTKRENPDDPQNWICGFTSIKEQLQYKFIACIEGVDVATNLKWVMSSNSIAIMTKPKFETWFMEGTLKADYHYIEVKDDYSDLIEKINYYISHPDEAEAIIQHAHEYVNQFKNKRIELATQLSVAQSYFEHCN